MTDKELAQQAFKEYCTKTAHHGGGPGRPFCGDFLPAKCSYKECAARAYEYLLNLGFIPTHWMNEETLAGENFWVNCLIASADAASTIAKFLDENK